MRKSGKNETKRKKWDANSDSYDFLVQSLEVIWKQLTRQIQENPDMLWYSLSKSERIKKKFSQFDLNSSRFPELIHKDFPGSIFYERDFTKM